MPQVAQLPMAFRIIYIFITYILWGSIFYTSINIPYGSMASAITANPAERGQLSTYRSVGAAVAGLVISVVVPLIIYEYDADGNQVILPNRFQLIAIVFAIAAFICYRVCYALSIERIETKPQAREKKPIAETLRSILSTKSLLSIIAAAVILLLSMLLVQSMNIFVYGLR